MLFVDLHAAFYTVIRSLLLEEQVHDDLLCQAMQRLGITPQDWHNVLGTVQKDNAAAGLSYLPITKEFWQTMFLQEPILSCLALTGQLPHLEGRGPVIQ